MGHVSAYAPYSGAVPATEYLGRTRMPGSAHVGGGEVVPFVQPGRPQGEVDDPELPEWVQEEYGGLHEGLESAEVTFQAETVTDDEIEEFVALTPAPKKRGRPKKVAVS